MLLFESCLPRIIQRFGTLINFNLILEVIYFRKLCDIEICVRARLSLKLIKHKSQKKPQNNNNKTISPKLQQSTHLPQETLQTSLHYTKGTLAKQNITR